MNVKSMISDFDIVYMMLFFIVTVVVLLAYLLSSKNPKRPRRVKIIHTGIPGLRGPASGWTRNVSRDDRDDRELDDSTERPGPLTTPGATPPPPPPAAFSLMNN